MIADISNICQFYASYFQANALKITSYWYSKVKPDLNNIISKNCNVIHDSCNTIGYLLVISAKVVDML